MLTPNIARVLVAGAFLGSLAAQPAAAQLTVCGSATGITPYWVNAACAPTLTFHVSGQCLSACGAVTDEFTAPDQVATGLCTLANKCFPYFQVQNAYNVQAREFFSAAWNMGLLCREDTGVKSSVTCRCVGCAPGEGPLNNTTPAEDPLLISVGDTEYRLTSQAAGVKFDLDGDGELEKTAWTAAGSDDAFLALDRNLNGSIDNGLEIFGDETPQLPSPEPNGFRALAVFDDPMSGGNGDGKIDQEDSVFGWLLLWTDSNHDGRSSSNELRGLTGLVTAIRLNYQRSFSKDEFGNELRFWVSLERPADSEGAIVAWNVFFANVDPAARK